MSSPTLTKQFDVLIAGAGVSGIAAAVAAARNGSSVMLVEKYGFLGGLATSAWVGTIGGAYYLTEGGSFEYANSGFPVEFLGQLASFNGLGRIAVHNNAVYVPYNHVAFKLAADKIVRSEPNITLLLHSHLAGIKTDRNRIESVTVYSQSGPLEIRSALYVDCSGDAVLTRLSGGGLQSVSAVQGASTLFVVAHVDVEKARAQKPDMVSRIMLRANMTGTLKIPRSTGFFFETGRPGEVVVSMTRIAAQNGRHFDPLDPEDLTRGELEGREQAYFCFNLLKDHMPGFEGSYLSDIAPQIGIRESRRIQGRYLLTREDVLSGCRFPDGIAWGCWPIELHSGESRTQWIDLKQGLRYQIPYRCLCPERSENLLVAGRCISASHEALGSCRVIGTCLAMGHSAGLIASHLATDKTPVSQIEDSRIREIMKYNDDPV